MLKENMAIVSKFFNMVNLSEKKEERRISRREKNELKIEKTNLNLKYNELKQRLCETKQELNAAIDNFNSVTDPKLTDVFIYKIQSEEAKYEHILREIKNKYDEM